MLVFNTTYLVAKASEIDFLAWMKAVYVPAVRKTGLVGAPRLYKVLVSEEEELEQMLFLRFGESVLHFSTYLKSCAI